MFQSQTQSMPGAADAAKKAAAEASSLLSGYQRNALAFDEFLADDSKPRPHYANLTASLQEFSAPELRRRRDTCEIGRAHV